MVELDDAIHTQIKSLCERGDVYADDERYAQAIGQYAGALELLPDPVEQWQAVTWILAALGDTYFQAGDYPLAREALSHAMRCPGAIGNPFLHLRLGQVQYELGNMDRAKDELARALILEGKRIFQDEDPKYLDYVTPFLEPPSGGW